MYVQSGDRGQSTGFGCELVRSMARLSFAARVSSANSERLSAHAEVRTGIVSVSFFILYYHQKLEMQEFSIL